MHDLPYRAAIAALFVAGVLTLAMAWGAGASAAGTPSLLVWQGWWLQALLGAGLMLSAFVPALRLAVLGGAILSKAGLLAFMLAGAGAVPWTEAGVLALLLPAAAVLGFTAWRHARWEGVLPLRLEA